MRISECDPATQERVREICQELFHNNYITEFIFAPNESLKKANPSYSFIMLHFDVIEELLDQCGWRLHHDDSAGVLYLSSEYVKAKTVLNKMESYFLLALRLLYDENRTKASASGEVFVTARDIVEQLTTLNAVAEVTKQDRERALRTLANKNIISRMTGAWGDIDVRIAVLPSIVCAISPEKTKAVREMISVNAREFTQNDEDAREDDDSQEDEDILRDDDMSGDEDTPGYEDAPGYEDTPGYEDVREDDE